MNTYQFTLTFALPNKNRADDYLDVLFEAGCDDALVGTGIAGSIALEFERQATSAEQAIQKAMRQVNKAIPNAELLELEPDLVGISDMAALLGCSRQNIRKFVVDNDTDFPTPSVLGNVPLWHYCEVASWMLNNKRTKIKPPKASIEVAEAAFKYNVDTQQKRYQRNIKQVTR